jgi:hypothetical protein
MKQISEFCAVYGRKLRNKLRNTKVDWLLLVDAGKKFIEDLLLVSDVIRGGQTHGQDNTVSLVFISEIS